MDFPFPIFGHKMTCFFHYMGNSFTFSFCSLSVLFSDLSADSKIKDLLTLVGQEMESVPDDKMEHQGSLQLQLQHLMLQHFGSVRE